MEIKLPTSWDDISIGQYIELRPIFNKKMDEIVELIYTLAVLLKKPIQDIEKIKVDDYKPLRKKLLFLKNTPLPREMKDRFEIDGTHYRIVTNARQLNGGQYMSVVTKLKDADTDPEVVYNSLHEILASISVPVIKKHSKWSDIEIEPSYYKDTAELFYNKLPMSIANPMGVFFWNLSQSLMTTIQDYSKRKLTEAETMKEEVMKDFLNDGDGGLRSITSVMEILQNGDSLKT